MNERTLSSGFQLVVLAAVIGLALTVALTDPTDLGNRVTFYCLVFMASLGGFGLLTPRLPAKARRRLRLRPWLSHSAVWALLLTLIVVLFSERPENGLPGAFLFISLGAGLYWYWSK